LPIGATEDMVIGSLDIERALREGLRAFQPGVLARANRNILYIDEVNLLPDNIVDVILDAAASGWNYVEREGISVSHPARFILVGTMNPEEGELRPQLLDRFSLSVSVHTIKDEGMRAEIIRRNMEYFEDPIGFYEKYKTEQNKLRERILKAREIVPEVVVSEELLYAIARLSVVLEVDGHRPDIVIAITAKTIAAFEGRREVRADDVLKAAKLALPHRTRRGGFLEPATMEEIERAFKHALKDAKKLLAEARS